MGSAVVVTMRAAHRGPTRSHSMATQRAAWRRWQRGQHTTAQHAGGSTVVAATQVAHCSLTRTQWRHDGQCSGGDDTGSTLRPDTQPLDGDTTGSVAAVAMWAAHH